MIKKYSIVSFVLLTVIAILGILLCVCPFSVPASTDQYNGFLNSIQKGIDLNGGVTAIYNCELSGNSNEDLPSLIDNSLVKIENLLEQENYPEMSIVRQGENKVRVEVSGAISDSEVFAYLQSGNELSFTLEQASDSVDPTVYLNGDNLTNVSVYYDYESEGYGFTFTFSNQGRAELKQLKERAELTSSSTIYIYFGEVSSENLLGEITSDTISGNSFSFVVNSSNAIASNTTELSRTLYEIVGSSLGYEISLIEASAVSPILGQNTLLYIGIASLVLIMAIYVALYIRYGTLGLLGILTNVFSLIIYLFLLQAIPFITLNLAGIFGSLLALMTCVISMSIIFEKIKKEYALGKKIHLSCRGGLKKALWPILDSHFILILASIFIWIFAPSSLKIFGITLILGALVSMFSSLVILRYLIKIYLPLNSKNAKAMRLYRDKNVKELKDEIIVVVEDEQSTNPDKGGEIA